MSDWSRMAAALALSLAVASCGMQAGIKETATANADGSLALIEQTEPAPGGRFENLFIEARGRSSGSRYQIAGFPQAREVHPQWIGQTTVALCIDPPAPFLVSEVKVRPTDTAAAAFNGGFAQALGAAATITVIQACAGQATAAPPPAADPAATASPAAAGG